jgi:hypothetical protein
VKTRKQQLIAAVDAEWNAPDASMHATEYRRRIEAILRMPDEDEQHHAAPSPAVMQAAADDRTIVVPVYDSVGRLTHAERLTRAEFAIYQERKRNGA